MLNEAVPSPEDLESLRRQALELLEGLVALSVRSPEIRSAEWLRYLKELFGRLPEQDRDVLDTIVPDPLIDAMAAADLPSPETLVALLQQLDLKSDAGVALDAPALRASLDKVLAALPSAANLRAAVDQANRPVLVVSAKRLANRFRTPGGVVKLKTFAVAAEAQAAAIRASVLSEDQRKRLEASGLPPETIKAVKASRRTPAEAELLIAELGAMVDVEEAIRELPDAETRADLAELREIGRELAATAGSFPRDGALEKLHATLAKVMTSLGLELAPTGNKR